MFKTCVIKASLSILNHFSVNLIQIDNNHCLCAMFFSKLAWVGQQILSGGELANYLEQLGSMWYISGLPLPTAPSVSRLLHFPTQFSLPILSKWPNHVRCVCCMTVETSLIPNLAISSSEGVQSETDVAHPSDHLLFSSLEPANIYILSLQVMFHCHKI